MSTKLNPSFENAAAETERLYRELAQHGIEQHMVSLDGFLAYDGTKRNVNGQAIKLNYEDDGDELVSIKEMLGWSDPTPKPVVAPEPPKTESAVEALMKQPFKELKKDLWDYIGKADYLVFVTTNGSRKQNGNAVMGRGCAKEAKDRFQNIAVVVGEELAKSQKVSTEKGEAYRPPVMWLPQYKIGILPVKYNWYDKADLALIEDSIKNLKLMVNHFFPDKNVVLPRPGCGAGGKDWLTQVKPILDKYLDGRFIVVNKD